MRKYIRHTDELIELQDKAIKALQQALLATQLALEVLQKDRDERGQQEQWNGQYPNTFPNTNPFYAPPTYVPYGNGWAAPIALPTVTVTNSNGQVYDITGLKQDQDKKMWLEYEQSKAAANVNSGSSLGYSTGYITKVN